MQSIDTATWLDLMPGYLEHLRLKKRSPRTIELRTYQLKRFFLSTGLLPAATTIDDLRRYMDNPRWAPNTCQVVRSSIGGFFGFLHDEEILPTNPAKRLESPKVPNGKPSPASDLAVAQALANATPRVRLMVQIGIFTGLRAMEIAAVRSDDVTFNQAGASLRVLGKGSKTRIVPLSDDVAALILSDDPGYLFPGKRPDTHISPAYVSRLVSKVLPPGVTCHKLRHRFASRAYLNSGNDLRAVQMLLGHASIGTTEHYVSVADDSLRAAALSAA